MIYSFTFIGEPVAQGRPRFSYKYGIYRAIDPPKSKTFKENLSFFLKKQMQKNKYRISEKKISITLNFFRSIPQSLSKKRKKEIIDKNIKPKTKPDLDNYIKSVLDALNKIVYKDDSQIVALHAYKHYAINDNPHIEIDIIELEDDCEE